MTGMALGTHFRLRCSVIAFTFDELTVGVPASSETYTKVWLSSRLCGVLTAALSLRRHQNRCVRVAVQAELQKNGDKSGEHSTASDSCIS
jgi:hypothetical protein